MIFALAALPLAACSEPAPIPAAPAAPTVALAGGIEYDPARAASGLRVPVLLMAAPADRFAPFAAVEEFARTVPNATVEKLEGDHFDVYSPPARDRAADLAAGFLAEHLSPR